MSAADMQCERCPHLPHNGLCGCGVNLDRSSNTYCACTWTHVYKTPTKAEPADDGQLPMNTTNEEPQP